MNRHSIAALTLFAVVRLAADLSGDWVLDLDPDFGGIQSRADCIFKQDGPRLVVDCGNGPTITGTVDGRRVTLLVKTGQKNEYTATFVGELDQRETRIAGTWELTADHGRQEGKFTATKR